MTNVHTCRACGATLQRADEPCPRCLLALGRQRAGDESEVRASTSAPARRRPALSVEEIARRFPELEVVGLIGEGGMGAVYRARQPKIDRAVALKVLGFDPSDHPAFAERFRREAVALARLDHPHIVKLYDFGERDGLFYLLLEFVDGTNLRALMKQGLAEPRQALAIVPQICQALQFAHDEGVVHRDIKPENVLIDKQGRVKIADFGLAKLTDADAPGAQLTEVGQVMGTPHYMAPEQLRGARDVDHRADIYSLGVVFYEMLTGELPRGNFELPSKRIQVDVKLDEIVLKSLERAPERRYQHALEVKTDVERVGDAGERSHVHAFVDSIARQAREAVKADVARGRERRRGRRGEIYGVYGIHPNRPREFFVFYLVAWILAGAAFNGGAAWFVLAMLLIASGFWSSMTFEVKRAKELDQALQSESRDVIAARHIASMLVLGAAFVTLFFGEISLFEPIGVGYRSGPAGADWMGELSTRLVPLLESRGTLTWPLGRPSFAISEQSLDLLGNEDARHQPLLIVAAFFTFVVAAAIYASRWRDLLELRGWKIPLRVTSTLFVALFALHGVCALIHLASEQREPLAPIVRAEPVDLAATAPRTDVGDELRVRLIERGYRINALGTWKFASTDSAPSSVLRIGFADPESSFERWHIGWQGPTRATPHLVFVLRGAKLDGTSNVQFDLGDAADSAWTDSWRAWIGALVAAPRQP